MLAKPDLICLPESKQVQTTALKIELESLYFLAASKKKYDPTLAEAYVRNDEVTWSKDRANMTRRRP